MSFGKKTRNPGWQPGNHWVKCDVCDFVYRDSEMFERWDGTVVCKYDWEPRHSQDLIRGVEDKITPEGFIRPDDDPNMGITVAEAEQQELDKLNLDVQDQGILLLHQHQ